MTFKRTRLEETGILAGMLHRNVREEEETDPDIALRRVVPVSSNRLKETEPVRSLAPVGTHVILPIPERGHTVVLIGATRKMEPTEVAQ